MRSRTTLLYGLLALGVAVWLYSSWSSDRRRIERQLGELRALVEKDGKESALVGANKARQVGQLFGRDFALELGAYGQVINDRARVAQVVLQYRTGSERIGVDFRDQELAVDSQLRLADMTLVASVTGTLDGDAYRERYRLRLRWVEEDGEWRIQRVELFEVLEGRPGFF